MFSFIFAEILFLTTLFSFWTVQCDIFVDETGETEVIPIDDFLQEEQVLKSFTSKPCEEKILTKGAHSRSKRDEYDSENEEGSGEAYEDEKEVRSSFQETRFFLSCLLPISNLSHHLSHFLVYFTAI